MKLLAVFGFSLAVVAIDKSMSGNQKQLIYEPSTFRQLIANPLALLELFKIDSNNSVLCFYVLRMVHKGWINLAGNPEITLPLVRYCLETGGQLVPENPFKVSVINAAAFIFMFRARGDEEAAKSLYNIVMEKHFSVEFKAELHNQPYTLDPVEYFQRFKTGHTELLLSSLKTERERQLFFMLWTVQMFGNGLVDQGSRQRILLKYSYRVGMILVHMGFSPDLLITWVIMLQKELPVGTTPGLLDDLWLVFFSLTKDWYSRLQESEKIQLRVFLEKYLRFAWSGFRILKESLVEEELNLFRRVMALDCYIKCDRLFPDTSAEFAGHFCDLTLRGYPIFFLKQKFDFYLENSSFPNGEILDTRYCLLAALIGALDMVREELDLKITENEECPREKLAYRQIKRTAVECYSDISKLLAKFSKEDPVAMEKWEKDSFDRTDSARNFWTAFRKSSKTCADLGLSN